jgi:hypothetical protein
VLLNSVGAPASGNHTVQLTLWDDASSTGLGSQKYATTRQTVLVDARGFFRVVFDTQGLDAVKANPNLWVQLEVDTVILPRSKLGAVPYAVEANRAALAARATNADLAATATRATNADNAAVAATANAAGGALATTLTGLQTGVGVGLRVVGKGGNNGTASCENWCTNASQSPTGTCVGAQWQTGSLSGSYTGCSSTVGSTGQPGVANLMCWCSRPQ